MALTGAGISVPSGIPDFRTPRTGLWENVDPMEVAHIDAFHEDPVRFWSFYGERFASLEGKLPNGAHAALARMEQMGLLDGVITQNIDMLHRRAGSRELVEVHGTIATCSCLSCPGHVELEEVRRRQAAADDGVPRCEHCGSPLKPDVVLFGEFLDPVALARARALCEGADLLLCIGSSLEVHPVAGAADGDARARRRAGDPDAGLDAAGRAGDSAPARRRRERAGGSAERSLSGRPPRLHRLAVTNRIVRFR